MNFSIINNFFYNIPGETSSGSDEAGGEADAKGGRAPSDPRQAGDADEELPGVRAEVPAGQRREDAAG